MSFLALSVDHPVAKLYENDSKFLSFKKNVLQAERQKKRLQMQKSWVLKQIL
jgi:hypothetical protein